MNVFCNFFGDFKQFLPSKRDNFSKQHSIGRLPDILILRKETKVNEGSQSLLQKIALK
jgi:hypothetical protein